MSERDSNYFVFFDTKGKRWPRLRLLIVFGGTLLFIALVLFFQSLLVTSQLQLPAAVREMKARLKVLASSEAQNPPGKSKPVWVDFAKKPLAGQSQSAPPPRHRPQGEIRLGFVVGWDPGSHESLREHGGDLTHLCPEWLTMVDGEGNLAISRDLEAADLAKKHHLILLPLLSNLEGNDPNAEAVEGVINGSEQRRQRFVAALLSELRTISAGGVVIDWMEIDVAYRQEMTTFLLELAAALHQEKMELWLSIPAGKELNVFDLESLAAGVDHFIAILHDENSEKDPPGPIASQEWFTGWLEVMTEYGHPEQWIVAIGSYGYDWTAGEELGEEIDFDDAMTRAGRAGLHPEDILNHSLNPHFQYLDNGVTHTVWFLDAISALNQMRAAAPRQVGGFAISRLGTEDPGIWKVLAIKDKAQPSPQDFLNLEEMRAEGKTSHVGVGEFLSVEPTFADGKRQVHLDEDGTVLEIYKKFPTYRTVFHQGQGRVEDVAITFDDGPDPLYTPRILDILKAEEVKAAFFLVGTNIESHPALTRRIVEEGHEIGIHTYSHPNLATVSKERAFLELNATERLIEAVTGRSTILFRPPYNADSRPHLEAELKPVQLAQELGFLTVSDDIDPEDWHNATREGIVERIKELRPQGRIILLHDAGGNRSATVAALPEIISYLKTRGDHLVPLGAMIGESREILMPPLRQEHPTLARIVSASGFQALHLVEELLWAFMIVATALTFGRALFVAAVAFLHRRRERRSGHLRPYQPPVSIVLAAYNEEKVIGETLAAVVATTYPAPFEVVVVDDGSTDATAAIVAKMATEDHRIRLIRTANRGKARALQTGLAAATHDALVTLDADTRFAPGTIGHLIEPLRDLSVAAVSGHVLVGNPRTFLARCQALEYICGFNLDRRAYDLLDCITVVPGAASSLRKEAVLGVGGISTDTLAEDTDLTLALHRLGWRVRYAPRALAWTETPESLADLIRQRFRWGFGTLQCLWKHRDLVFKPGQGFLGWFSLPSTWFFQILLVALTPLVDILLLFSLCWGAGSEISLYFLIFLLTDLFLAIAACLVEGEPLRQTWRIVPMRFLYRPLLAWVVWKSVFKALKGAWVRWDKLKRTASVVTH